MYQGVQGFRQLKSPSLSSCRGAMRIVFTTFGWLGDLHPYLAIAIEMKRRGYEADRNEQALSRKSGKRRDLLRAGPAGSGKLRRPVGHGGESDGRAPRTGVLFRETPMPALRDSFKT